MAPVRFTPNLLPVLFLADGGGLFVVGPLFGVGGDVGFRGGFAVCCGVGEGEFEVEGFEFEAVEDLDFGAAEGAVGGDFVFDEAGFDGGLGARKKL